MFKDFDLKERAKKYASEKFLESRKNPYATPDLGDFHDWEEEYLDRYRCSNCKELKPIAEDLESIILCYDCSQACHKDTALGALYEIQGVNALSNRY